MSVLPFASTGTVVSSPCSRSGRHDVRLQPIKQRHQRRGAGAHLVGQSGQAQRHAFAGVALGLAVPAADADQTSQT